MRSGINLLLGYQTSMATGTEDVTSKREHGDLQSLC